jgi:integral membrane sensor domain MASE1
MGEMTGLALRHVAPIRPLPSWRLALAVLILGAALAGAATLYWHQFVSSCAPPDLLVLCRSTRKPGWVDPVSVAICLLGVVAAAGVLMTPRRSQPE